MKLTELEASTKRATLQSTVGDITSMACTTTSDPATCPAQVCKGLVADTTSLPTEKKMAFTLIQ